MATPTGQISFADLNVEILQGVSTSQINLNDAGVRLGYGATSQVSISNLKKCYGATVTCGTYTDPKFFTKYDGVSTSGAIPYIGSIDDPTITPGGMAVQDVLEVNDSGSLSVLFGLVETGFEGTNVNRFATSGTSRTLGSSGTDNFGATASLPDSGTVTIGIRWT